MLFDYPLVTGSWLNSLVGKAKHFLCPFISAWHIKRIWFSSLCIYSALGIWALTFEDRRGLIGNTPPHTPSHIPISWALYFIFSLGGTWKRGHLGCVPGWQEWDLVFKISDVFIREITWEGASGSSSYCVS